MNTIHDLSEIESNRTDKRDSAHTFQGQNYLHVYERYFEPRRHTAKKILEIGVLGGYSLRLWRDYFPNAHIVGMDIDPTLAGSWERIDIIKGDQSCHADLDTICSHAPFDIIIDDGSHISSHIFTSFTHLWAYVSSNGLYCIEDTRCTYDGADGGWPGMHYNKLIPVQGDRFYVDYLLKHLTFKMDTLSGDARAIHIHPMQIIIEKL